jgi:hypothetical protein
MRVRYHCRKLAAILHRSSRCHNVVVITCVLRLDHGQPPSTSVPRGGACRCLQPRQIHCHPTFPGARAPKVCSAFAVSVSISTSLSCCLLGLILALSSACALPVELFGPFPIVVCSFAARSGVTCPHDLCLGQMRAGVDCQLFVCGRHAQLQILSDDGKLAAPETVRYLARLRVALAFCRLLGTMPMR